MCELYIVATPIGNLGDITLRAIETLKKVDVIAAEDTRHTLELLNALETKGYGTHFEFKKIMVSCRAQNEKEAAVRIIQMMNEGKSVAFVSDAGTPALSDPGAVLVEQVRTAGFTVVPIPGPSAFATLLSVAGVSGKTVIFEGFLSPKPGRRKNQLKGLFETGNSIILYESPFRIIKLLNDIADIDSERRIVVGRELTKIHEEIVDGKACEVRDIFSERQKNLGEFAIFISGKKNSQLSDEGCR